ncbi:glycosyltransferase family 2 protein [Microbacterium aurum]
MTNTPPAGHPLRWHSEDFLVRLVGQRDLGSVESAEWNGAAERTSTSTGGFGASSLNLVADAQRYQQLSVQRSKAFLDRDLVVFGARTRSMWALDVLVGRLTGFALDWPSFRASALDAVGADVDPDSAFGRIVPDKLYDVVELLHERKLDPKAERVLLRLIANRVDAGADLKKERVEPLVERLLQAGLADAARPLIDRVPAKTWMRHAFNIELAHPRHGGSYARMLSLFNEPYRRLALESIELSGEGETPFQRLDARPLVAADRGPLVTVIMTSWSPGREIFTAVRSIVNQTYENWELIVTDDASPVEANEILDQIEALDPRIIVVRNEVNAGTYVRRNEAIERARGEFVTMQDSDDWSHPHRLETQVRDLVATPGRFANVVHAARVTQDFSVVSNRGARLFLAEPSLMFRRTAVTTAIGYYDSVRKSADTEFRKRLEAVTGKPIPALVEGAPLMVMLADEGSLSGGDFGTNIWNHPDRLTYWSATRRYLDRIKKGVQDPYLPFPQLERAFHAPRTWVNATPTSVDLLVVLDGRQFPEYADFHAIVVKELRVAVDSGRSVAVAQSDAIRGPRGMAFFPAELQELVDRGEIARIGAAEPVSASTVIVRHAVSAQGHPGLPWQVEASKVIVVEDALGGDKRGATISKGDVVDTVSAWFGVEPTWVVAPPVLPAPRVTSCSLIDGELLIALETAAPEVARAVRVVREGQSVDAVSLVSGATSLIATVPVEALDSAEWYVTVESDAGDGGRITEMCQIAESAVVSSDSASILLRTDSGGLRLLTDGSSDGYPSRADIAAAHLSASVAKVSIVDERLDLIVETGGTTNLIALYALRRLESGIVRRRDFTGPSSADDGLHWQRPLDKFVDAKWNLVGSFKTPLGIVEYPIPLNAAVAEGSARWHPYFLSGDRLLVAQTPPESVRLACETRPPEGGQVFAKCLAPRFSWLGLGLDGERLRVRRTALAVSTEAEASGLRRHARVQRGALPRRGSVICARPGFL